MGPDVRVEIKYFGIGIIPANQKRLYDRYYRVVHSANVVGGGLGMYTSQEYVKLHSSERMLSSKLEWVTPYTLL